MYQARLLHVDSMFKHWLQQLLPMNGFTIRHRRKGLLLVEHESSKRTLLTRSLLSEKRRARIQLMKATRA